MAQIYRNGKLIANLNMIVKQERTWIMYSDDPTTGEMTSEYAEQAYIGLYTGLEASTNAEDYDWISLIDNEELQQQLESKVAKEDNIANSEILEILSK